MILGKPLTDDELERAMRIPDITSASGIPAVKDGRLLNLELLRTGVVSYDRPVPKRDL